MKNIIILRIQTIIAVLLCSMIFGFNPAIAQVQPEEGRTGVLPNHMVDTRSLSMAGATIADIYGEPSIGINVALSGLAHGSSSLQYNSNHDWDSNFMQHNLMLPTLSLGAHHITARFGLIHRGDENLPFTNMSSLPEPDITSYQAELAYSISLSSHFSIGTLQSVSYTNTNEDAQYWNYFTDIGLVYAPQGPVSYGLIFRGLGNETTYETTQAGQTLLGSRLATQTLEIGATLRYPVEKEAYMSISFANEKRFGEDGMWYKGGIEIMPFSVISIRGGAIVNFEPSTFIPRMGLGINAGVFKIDYMTAPKNLMGEQFHQLGLTIQF